MHRQHKHKTDNNSINTDRQFHITQIGGKETNQNSIVNNHDHQ